METYTIVPHARAGTYRIVATATDGKRRLVAACTTEQAVMTLFRRLQAKTEPKPSVQHGLRDGRI
jgi:hypothetical protein